MKGSKKSATAALLRGCFTGYNKMKNRDVQLYAYGIAWLHPEIPFCTQTGRLLLKSIDSKDQWLQHKNVTFANPISSFFT